MSYEIIHEVQLSEPTIETHICLPRPGSWQYEESEGYVSSGNFAYVCPICLSVWARIRIVSKDGIPVESPIKYEILSHCCERHSIFSWQVSGSLLHPWGGERAGYERDPYLLDSFPEALVARELRLHLKFCGEGE